VKASQPIWQIHSPESQKGFGLVVIDGLQWLAKWYE